MKSAQVTLFVIFGLVLVIVAAFFIVVFKSPDQPTITTHDFDAVSATYENQVSYCLLNEGYDAFRRIMVNGGYNNPLEHGFVAIKDFPLRGSALPLSDNRYVPFWLEHKGGVTCTSNCPISLNIPPLYEGEGADSIEEQAELLLSSTITNCLERITLPDDYSLRQAEDTTVDIIIGQELITYELTREATITYLPNNEEKTILQVSAQDKADLAPLYDMGVALVQELELSNYSTSFGDVIVQVISAYGMDDMIIPPINGGTSFETSPSKSWLLPDVKEHVKVYLADNIPLINIRGARSETLFLDDNPYSQAIYHTAPFVPDVILPHPDKIPDMSINFLYDPSWDIDMRVQPGSGYLIRPDSTVFSPIPLMRFGVTDYRFTYDLRMPILVILTDEESFGGKGLTLMYAIETGITQNQPIQYGDFSSLFSDDHSELFSKDNQRMDGLVTITAINAVSGQPLPEVYFTYICGDSSTDAGVTNASGMSQTSLPFCMGGSLVGSLPDFYSLSQEVNSVSDEAQNITELLSPVREYNLEIRKKILAKVATGSFGSFTTWQLGNASGYIDGQDELIYVFTRKTLPGEESFMVTGTINVSSQVGARIKLAQGEYDLEIHDIRFFSPPSTFTVPADEVCWDEDPLNPFGGEKCETIPAIVFNSTMVVGGLLLNAEQDNSFVINQSDLLNDTITLTYLEINLDDIRKHEDLEVIGDVERYSVMYADQLKPRFSNEE